MIDSIIFRIYDYFEQKDQTSATQNSIYFIAILLGSLIVPIFMIANLILDFYVAPTSPDPRMKYYIGFPLALICYILSRSIIKRRLTKEKVEELRKKYSKIKYRLSIWVIFMIPVFNVFIVPIFYGLLNGTLRFPLFE